MSGNEIQKNERSVLHKARRLPLGEVIFTLVLIVTGLVWVVGGLFFGIWDRVTLAGGFMLLFVGGVLLLLGVLVLLRLLRSQTSEQDKTLNARLLVATMVVALVSVPLMNRVLGTMLTLVLFMLLWLIVYRRVPVIKSLVVTACTMGTIYVIFVMWLNVRFPTFLGLGIL